MSGNQAFDEWMKFNASGGAITLHR